MINHRLKVGLGVCKQLPPSPANDTGLEPENIASNNLAQLYATKINNIFDILHKKQKNLTFFKKNFCCAAILHTHVLSLHRENNPADYERSLTWCSRSIKKIKSFQPLGVG